MAIKFNALGYQWSIRSGLPPAGGIENENTSLVVALRAKCPELETRTEHEIASWIVARLSYITAGALEIEGDTFENDSNDFGYMISVTDSSGKNVALGGVMMHEKRTYFASVKIEIDDFQRLFVELLAENPNDLDKCDIRVRYPETKRFRHYGWDGYSLIR